MYSKQLWNPVRLKLHSCLTDKIFFGIWWWLLNLQTTCSFGFTKKIFMNPIILFGFARAFSKKILWFQFFFLSDFKNILGLSLLASVGYWCCLTSRSNCYSVIYMDEVICCCHYKLSWFFKVYSVKKPQVFLFFLATWTKWQYFCHIWCFNRIRTSPNSNF